MVYINVPMRKDMKVTLKPCRIVIYKYIDNFKKKYRLIFFPVGLSTKQLVKDVFIFVSQTYLSMDNFVSTGN